MRKQGLLWAGFLLLSTSMMGAQSGPESVCEVNVSAAKPGGAKQWEQARKQHNQFHKAEKDTHAVEVWSILTGPASGRYLTTVCGMTWKEMDSQDAFDQRDAADREKNLELATGENQMSFYVFRPDLSNAGVPDGPPTKMLTVTHFFVKPGGIEQFTDAIKKIKAAIAETKYPAKSSRWYQLANGGDGPHYVLVTDRKGWADMQPPEQSLSDALKQAYGNDDKTLQTLREAVDRTMSEMMTYRADLSYAPAK